ncbi:MAG: 16S rRNA (guanine(527)-N(7))-methyltransferase RsmG [Planctomycetota bacterium]|jgi:16S rRNA (guanine527-N7)-methyltransferase
MLETLSAQQQKKFETFASLLIEAAKTTNLTSIKEPDQIISRHFEDSLIVLHRLRQVQQILPSKPFLVDIGSGAGLPALALAVTLPDWHITSIEATGKKAEFQLLVTKELNLQNVRILNARAEDIAHDPEYREKFDVTVTRAIGSLAMIAEFSVPLLRVGGIFLAWKGPKVESELKKGQNILTKLGCEKLKQSNYNLPTLEGDFRIIEAEKIKPTPQKYPREFKTIKKNS